MSINLGGSLVAPGAANPEAAVNTRLGRVDGAITEDLAVDLSAGNGVITLSQAQTCIFIILNGASVARDCTIDACKRILFFRNTGSADVTVKRGSASIVIPAGETSIARLDGTTNGLLSISGGGGVGSSLPAGGTTGQVLTKQSNSDGDADWSTPSSGGGSGGGWFKTKPPVSADFAVTTTGTGLTASDTDNDNNFVMKVDGVAGEDRSYFRGNTVPGGTSWYVECGCFPSPRQRNFYVRQGVGLRESSTGKIIIWGFCTEGGTPKWNILEMPDENSYGSATQVQNLIGDELPAPQFFRIDRSGSNYNFSISQDGGYSWDIVATKSVGSTFTADQYGLILESFDTGYNAKPIPMPTFYYADTDRPV